MAENKKSFLLYCDLIHTVKKMPMLKRGELLTIILEYVNDENPTTEDMIVDLVFEPIKQQLKRDLRKWENTSETRSEVGRKGGLASGIKRKEQKEANEAIALMAKQKEANASKRTDNVTVTVNDSVNVKEKIKKLFVEDSNEYQLSKLLYDLILVRNPDHKEPNLQTWAKNIDLMLRLDKRTKDQIEGAIRWSQQDHFWQTNILSTKKLRDQYDQLYLKAKNGTSKQDIRNDKLRQAAESIANDPDLIR